ncbi:sensor histidine kinase [Variovorax sp. LT1P1]|uniref:sensor histidine kinase n=1 Tax=Variovorax sp. LT1P1 TaxID=3443730 RepID=UPI003F46B3CE
MPSPFASQPLGGIHAAWGHEATERLSIFKAWLINQLAFILATVGVFLAEAGERTISTNQLQHWLVVAVLGWVVRGMLYVRTMDADGGPIGRIVPYVISGMAFMHWAWTAQLFLNSEAFTTTAAVIFIAFIMMSIAMAIAWLHSPVPVALYVVGLWACLSWQSVSVDLLPAASMAAIDACVALTMGIAIYWAIRLRPLITRSQQESQIVRELRSSNASLEALRSEASATLKERSVFFAGASHDFKQRLHAMKLMAYSTLSSLPENDDAQWALRRMSAEVEDMEDYFKKVLEFARVEAMDIEPKLETIALQKLMQKVDLHFENVALMRGVDLTFRTSRLQVVSDPSMLQRMLENLVSNALKFTSKRVLVAARARGDEVVLEVWDQGPGIEESQLSRIFEAFHQIRRTPGLEEAGVGLGLALVKRFADLLGGRVTVSSRVGRGTVFRLHLKRARSNDGH